MKGNFDFGEIELDLTPEDCGEMIRRIRESNQQAQHRLAALIFVEYKEIVKAESGGENAFVILRKVLELYQNIEYQFVIKVKSW